MADAAGDAPQVRCRVFGGSQGRGLLAVWMGGMLVLSGALALGVPAPIAVPLLLGAMILGTRRLAGTAVYTLEEHAVRREWTSLAGGARRVERRELLTLRAWKLDHTVSRGFARYEFLELDGEWGSRWIITSRQDPEGFARFRSAFEQRLAGLAAEGIMLRRRRGFFETLWGKAVSLLLAAGVGGLVVAALSGMVALTGLIKLAIFLAPGALYMLWRSFGPRGETPMARPQGDR